MGYLTRTSTVVSTGRPQGSSDPFGKMYSGYYPPEWQMGLATSGVDVTPELALILTAMYSGVTRIGGDFMRMPAHVLRVRDDGGKDRVRGGPLSGGIGSLAYRLRWKPNHVQTAAAFFACLAAQYTLRNRCYAEIQPDETGPFGQLLPRHPDRVTEERLANGKLRFKVTDPGGTSRAVTQEEMLYVHDTSGGGFSHLTRMQYGRQALGTAIAAEQQAGRFFKSGMNAAVVATHPGGEMEEEELAVLHNNITRFAAGKENSFGVLLIEDDIKISALGIDPEKAQLMLARNFGVREVARLLRMPPELLFADNTGAPSGKSWEEVNDIYRTGCLGQIVPAFEQAMQDALIVAKDSYIIEFLMDALFRGDLKSRSEYYEAALEGPWMWPSEIRVKEGMNPDKDLDALAEKRRRPADAKGTNSGRRRERDDVEAAAPSVSPRGEHRLHLLLHDGAIRALRRERAAVEKLGKKHADDVPKWQAALRTFYAEHAGFVAETMRVDIQVAREFCAQHGTALEATGTPVFDEHWERREAEELVGLAIESGRIAAA